MAFFQSRSPSTDQPSVGGSLRQVFQFIVLPACRLTALLAIVLITSSGCEKSAAPEFRLNSVKMLSQEKRAGEPFEDGYDAEIGTILKTTFGTPDEPEFPFFLGDEDPGHKIISIENLANSAGPVQSDRSGTHGGLYREHCAHCHGITGDGAGPTASILNPYPRDFRLGYFKFKSTPLRQPPTDHDLTKILKNGIPGTAMPSFRTLPDDELQSLVEYVKYLTIRGQFEHFLIEQLASLDGGSLIDYSLISKSKEGEEPSEDDLEEFDDQIYTILDEGLRQSIVKRWLKPKKKVTKIPDAPAAFNPEHANHDQFVAQGKDVFFSTGNCMQCHGETAYGDGQVDFDVWTKDWTAHVDPFDASTYQDFLKLGALPPRPIRPRNLHLGVYRGGSLPSDIYLRIANGIEGTPMPAASALSSEEIWSIVAYLRSLPYTGANADRESRPVNDKSIAR